MNTVSKPTPPLIPGLRQLWKIAFGDDDAFLDNFFSLAFAPDRCRCIIAGDTVAAALYWFDVSCQGRKMAYLYAVATHPDYRNQGLCRQLMTATHEVLTQQDYAGVVLVPQNQGVIRMYANMGYTTCTTVQEFQASAQDPAVLLHQVDQEEYACHRRALLPADGVVQEGANLNFLASYASFYTGDNFVAAIVKEGDNLLCPEILGDPKLAPGILTALECREGTFRCPGEETPFAMFLPLVKDCPQPGYFGHAFD